MNAPVGRHIRKGDPRVKFIEVGSQCHTPAGGCSGGFSSFFGSSAAFSPDFSAGLSSVRVLKNADSSPKVFNAALPVFFSSVNFTIGLARCGLGGGSGVAG